MPEYRKETIAINKLAVMRDDKGTSPWGDQYCINRIGFTFVWKHHFYHIYPQVILYTLFNPALLNANKRLFSALLKALTEVFEDAMKDLGCHKTGTLAPNSIRTQEDVQKSSDKIREVLLENKKIAEIIIREIGLKIAK